eukprot:5007690-Prymnesium_polylepis.1
MQGCTPKRRIHTQRPHTQAPPLPIWGEGQPAERHGPGSPAPSPPPASQRGQPASAALRACHEISNRDAPQASRDHHRSLAGPGRNLAADARSARPGSTA